MKLSTTMNGITSGIIATIPMTAVMYLTRALFSGHANHTLPPQQITDSVLNTTSIPHKLIRKEHPELAVASHFGYGAGTGVLYSHLTKPLQDRPLLHGVGFGLMVWTASYAGWLPALNLQPPVEHQPQGRNKAMILSHVVWGAALGLSASYLKNGRKTCKIPQSE